MNNLYHMNTIEHKGAKWHIYVTVDKDDPQYIDVWLQKDGLGIMDMVIGLKFEDGWRDYAAGPIMDFISSTEGDPRYE